jgi:hypothetical protein
MIELRAVLLVFEVGWRNCWAFGGLNSVPAVAGSGHLRLEAEEWDSSFEADECDLNYFADFVA